MPTGTSSLIGWLRAGATHEWFGSEAEGLALDQWQPPLTILAAVTGAWLGRDANAGGPNGPCRGGWIVWVGRRCWPLPVVLGRWADVSLFVDPPDDAARVWAIDLALRSAGVGIVIADAVRLGMAASRRLQLAAEAGRECRKGADGGVLGLLARPAWERKVLSAAATRWVTAPEQSETSPRWRVQLVRCKGVAADAGKAGDRAWIVEPGRDAAGRETGHAARAVRPPGAVVGRESGEEDRARGSRRRAGVA